MAYTRISVLFILLVVNSCITVKVIDRNATSVDLCPFWNFLPLHKNLSKGDFIEYRISVTYQNGQSYPLSIAKKGDLRFVEPKSITIGKKQFKLLGFFLFIMRRLCLIVHAI